MPRPSIATIKRDLETLREDNATWFNQNRRLKARMSEYLKRSVDVLNECIREAFVEHYKEGTKTYPDPRIRLNALNVILGAQRQINEVLGFLGANISDLEISERIDELETDTEDMKRTIANAVKMASSGIIEK